MAKLTGGAPVLLVADVAAATAYYREKLGFELVNLYGDPAYFGLVRRDAYTVCFARAAKKHIVPHYRVVPGTWNAYFWTDDVDALYAEFVARGAHIDYHLETKDYNVREFGVQDLDGYDVAFGQLLEAK